MFSDRYKKIDEESDQEHHQMRARMLHSCQQLLHPVPSPLNMLTLPFEGGRGLKKLILWCRSSGKGKDGLADGGKKSPKGKEGGNTRVTPEGEEKVTRKERKAAARRMRTERLNQRQVAPYRMEGGPGRRLSRRTTSSTLLEGRRRSVHPHAPVHTAHVSSH